MSSLFRAINYDGPKIFFHFCFVRVKESFTTDLHLLSIWRPKSYMYYVKRSYIRNIYIDSCHQGNTNENNYLIPPRNYTKVLKSNLQSLARRCIYYLPALILRHTRQVLVGFAMIQNYRIPYNHWSPFHLKESTINPT